MMRWVCLIAGLACWLGIGMAAIPSALFQSELSFPKETPSRIVTLAPNLTEIAYALGLGDRVVGVTQFSDYPSDTQTKPKVGSFWQLNVEAIVGCRPDLVLTLGFQEQQDVARRLHRLHITAQTYNIENFQQMITAVNAIGKLTDSEAQAEALTQDLIDRIETVKDKVSQAARPKVLWVVQRDPLRVAGRDTFINWIMETAGGENAIGPTLHQYPPIGSEQVLIAQPDVIIELLMDNARMEDQMAAARDFWRRYDNLPAVRDERLHVVGGDLIGRLGPRISEGVELMARIIHPQLFPEEVSDRREGESNQ